MFIKLAVWMKQRYGSTMYAALKTVLPAHKKQAALKHKYISLKMAEFEAREYFYECKSKNRKAQEKDHGNPDIGHCVYRPGSRRADDLRKGADGEGPRPDV